MWKFVTKEKAKGKERKMKIIIVFVYVSIGLIRLEKWNSCSGVFYFLRGKDIYMYVYIIRREFNHFNEVVKKFLDFYKLIISSDSNRLD